MCDTPQRPYRRHLLAVGLAATFAPWAAPLARSATNSVAALADGTGAGARFGTEGRLVVVFLRGAYDGLSALVPYRDAAYYRLRPTIAIAQSDATPLDETFGLAPALKPLLPLWQAGVLAVVPAAGSPDPTRSHFDAQHHWETGRPGVSSAAPGWLNRLAGWGGDGATHALGVGEANPQILAGPAPVQLVARGQAATRAGVLADERSRAAVMRLYGGSDALAQRFQSGASSRLQTSRTLMSEEGGRAMKGEGINTGSNGAQGSQGLALDAQHLGTLMRANPALRLGFLSAGGWDTHANQGAARGALATNLGNLAQALLQLRRDFDRPDDVVLVCSEFGRTTAENGTRGSDHGHGNALWLLGNRVQGGRWHGAWQGLEPAQLHEGRDLPVHHDFRAVLAQVLTRSLGVSRSAALSLFADMQWDTRLDALMRS